MLPWLSDTIAPLQAETMHKARAWQDQLTKPQGSLGTLEAIAIKIATLQRTLTPSVDNARIIIYAADHGVAQEQVSAFPQAVTAEMVKNFSSGGAAICVLSRQHQLPLQVVNLGLVSHLPELEYVEHRVIAPGTRNFTRQTAMTEQQLVQAFEIGKNQVDQFNDQGGELLIAGEMGIANSSSATALVCASRLLEPEQITGSGTGLDSAGVKHKIRIIRQALEQHKGRLNSALENLQALGGFELAALTASYIRCAQQGIIAVVDGFICTAAAMIAIDLQPQCRDWLIFSHQSAEQGHKTLLQLLDVKPLLQFDLRLGEASGAALVYPLLRSACLLHNEMASFANAAVSEKL